MHPIYKIHHMNITFYNLKNLVKCIFLSTLNKLMLKLVMYTHNARLKINSECFDDFNFNVI